MELEPGEPVPMIDETTVAQETHIPEEPNDTPDNISHSMATGRAISKGTDNIFTVQGSHKSEVNSYVPDVLAWTEYDLELKGAETLKNSCSESPRVPRSPFPLDNHSLSAIPGSSDKFLIFGGNMGLVEGKPAGSNDTFLLSTEDMSLTQLETGGAIPAKRAGHRAAIVGGTLIVFGGNVFKWDNYLYLLQLDTKMWSKFRPPSPFPRPTQGYSMTATSNAIWLFGGSEVLMKNSLLHSVCFDSLWCLQLGDSKSPGHLRWREVLKQGPWPKPRSFHTAIHHSGSLYIFGGECMDEDRKKFYCVNEVWKFNMQTETWTAIECEGSIPPPCCAHSAAIINDNMFIVGGLVRQGPGGYFIRTDEAFVFNITGHFWASLGMLGQPPLPSQRGTLWAAQSRLILLGGQSTDKPCLHLAETTQGSWLDSLAKIQFTTETTQLRFTSEVVDLSRFVRKQGDAAHALAGYSDVWKGEMTETREPLAIKVIRVASTGNLTGPGSDRLRTRFDRELTIWMECQHPRVLKLLGYAYIEGVPCLISPWCSNGNIMEYLAKNPNADHRQLINQVAEGLVYLHGREPLVVHSDIKPANVVVSDEGDAKICDFGISKFMLDMPSGFTTTATAKGTLRYFPKELLEEGARSTTMSDVYAFGMLILHVMTGKPPYFKYSTDMSVIMAIMSGKTPAGADYLELPSTDPYWDIMSECWSEDPNKRPTMAGTLDRLRVCVGNEES